VLGEPNVERVDVGQARRGDGVVESPQNPVGYIRLKEKEHEREETTV
jgi:hypothetical protein